MFFTSVKLTLCHITILISHYSLQYTSDSASSFINDAKKYFIHINNLWRGHSNFCVVQNSEGASNQVNEMVEVDSTSWIISASTNK